MRQMLFLSCHELAQKIVCLPDGNQTRNLPHSGHKSMGSHLLLIIKSKGLFTWHQNEFHSGMGFVPEWSSYRIHMTKSTDSAILKTTVLSTILKTIRMRHSPQTTRFAFSSRNGVRLQFTWYQNEMSYQNENFIRIENRNELIPEWLVRNLTLVSVSCKQIQRNIWGWNELGLEWKTFRYHVNGP